MLELSRQTLQYIDTTCTHKGALSWQFVCTSLWRQPAANTVTNNNKTHYCQCNVITTHMSAPRANPHMGLPLGQTPHGPDPRATLDLGLPLWQPYTHVMPLPLGQPQTPIQYTKFTVTNIFDNLCTVVIYYISPQTALNSRPVITHRSSCTDFCVRCRAQIFMHVVLMHKSLSTLSCTDLFVRCHAQIFIHVVMHRSSCNMVSRADLHAQIFMHSVMSRSSCTDLHAWGHEQIFMHRSLCMILCL